MILSYRELEVFRRVMEAGSVTRAAELLGISQPAVSKMLQQAEARLGFALFIRQRKQLLPTAEARALLPETINAFAAIDVVQRLAEDLRAGRSGTLTVAAIPALTNSIVATAVHRFRADRPDVSIILHPLPAQQVANLVADHRADLGAIVGRSVDAGVAASELGASALACLLRRDHPLADREFLRAADLAGVPLICPGRHHPVGALLSLAFADADLPFQIAVESAQASVAGALVREGAGVAVLDGFGMLAARQEGLVTLPFRPTIVSPARLLQPRHKPLSRAAQEFARLLKEAAAGVR